jgi:hypothetical protein
MIRGNRGHGLAVRDGAEAEVCDSIFEHNEFSGAGAPDASAGGRLSIRRCLFRGNGMRPIFRGPTHLDPIVPTTSEIRGDAVLASAAPFAEVDLYADRAGEASRFLETVTADARGEFRVSPAAARWPDVVTAAATTPDGHTSEFNVIAGPPSRAILAALLARAGPLSDAETDRIDMRSAVHRWRTGTRVSFRFETPAPPHVRRGAEWFAGRIPVWTAGNIRVDLRQGPAAPNDEPALVPIRYAPARDERLNGTGGTTYTRWDATGFFSAPIRIFLAEPEPGRPACPRVAIHEMCHALGLYHARVGLLSRLQGIPAPPPGYLNDFSPAPTFYDVTALQILYDNRLEGRVTLARLAAAGLMPAALPEESREMAARPIDADESGDREASSVGPPPVFSPPATSR